MKLLVRFRHIDPTPLLEAMVPRRIRFALDRLGHAIREVHVTLADVNGPKGGLDKACRVRVVGDRMGAIVVDARATEVEAALDEAATRAGRTAARALHRRRRLAYTG